MQTRTSLAACEAFEDEDGGPMEPVIWCMPIDRTQKDFLAFPVTRPILDANVRSALDDVRPPERCSRCETAALRAVHAKAPPRALGPSVDGFTQHNTERGKDLMPLSSRSDSPTSHIMCLPSPC